MKLTREQVIAEHRKMWRWIAEQYEKEYDIDPYQLKKIYFSGNWYDDPFLMIQSCCFLCDYVKELGDGRCNNCPLVWGTTGNYCMGTSGEHRGLYGQLMDCYLNRDIEKCAKLARQIADLPEKQQNIHYNKEETHTEERIDDD